MTDNQFEEPFSLPNSTTLCIFSGRDIFKLSHFLRRTSSFSLRMEPRSSFTSASYYKNVLKVRVMLSVDEITDFCMFLSTWLPFFSTSLFTFYPRWAEYPPRTSLMTLNCSTLQPSNCRFSSYHSGAYFRVISASF